MSRLSLLTFCSFLIVIAVIIGILTVGESFLASMTSDMVGAFTGVSLGLQVDGIIEERRNREKRKIIIADLKDELGEALKLLKEVKSKILPVDNWKSCVSSGELRILNIEERKRLSRTYFRIDMQNYESIRMADRIFDKPPSLGEVIRLRTRNEEMEKETAKVIEEMLLFLE